MFGTTEGESAQLDNCDFNGRIYPAHSLDHPSLTYLFTHLLTHAPTQLLNQRHTHARTHARTHLLTHALTHAPGNMTALAMTPILSSFRHTTTSLAESLWCAFTKWRLFSGRTERNRRAAGEQQQASSRRRRSRRGGEEARGAVEGWL